MYKSQPSFALIFGLLVDLLIDYACCETCNTTQLTAHYFCIQVDDGRFLTHDGNYSEGYGGLQLIDSTHCEDAFLFKFKERVGFYGYYIIHKNTDMKITHQPFPSDSAPYFYLEGGQVGSFHAAYLTKGAGQVYNKIMSTGRPTYPAMTKRELFNNNHTVLLSGDYQNDFAHYTPVCTEHLVDPSPTTATPTSAASLPPIPTASPITTTTFSMPETTAQVPQSTPENGASGTASVQPQSTIISSEDSTLSTSEDSIASTPEESTFSPSEEPAFPTSADSSPSTSESSSASISYLVPIRQQRFLLFVAFIYCLTNLIGNVWALRG